MRDKTAADVDSPWVKFTSLERDSTTEVVMNEIKTS